MLLSIVNKTSNSFSAWESNAPFFKPAQPTSGTDLTSCPGRSRCKRQSRFSSGRIFTSGRLQEFVAGFFQDCDHLFPLYTRKAFQEIIYRISTLKMIEQALHWNPGPYKHRCAAENGWVAVNDRLFFHVDKIIEKNRRSKNAFSTTVSAIPFQSKKRGRIAPASPSIPPAFGTISESLMVAVRKDLSIRPCLPCRRRDRRQEPVYPSPGSQ
jgi:hypothetical protein